MSQHLPAASPGQFFTPAVLYYGIRCAVLWNPLCCSMESSVLYYEIRCAVFCYFIQLNENRNHETNNTAH